MDRRNNWLGGCVSCQEHDVEGVIFVEPISPDWDAPTPQTSWKLHGGPRLDGALQQPNVHRSHAGHGKSHGAPWLPLTNDLKSTRIWRVQASFSKRQFSVGHFTSTGEFPVNLTLHLRENDTCSDLTTSKTKNKCHFPEWSLGTSLEAIECLSFFFVQKEHPRNAANNDTTKVTLGLAGKNLLLAERVVINQDP